MGSSKKIELLKPIDNNIDDLKKFINNTNDTLIKEEIASKETIINQLLGHYNQLLVRIQDIINKYELNNFIIKRNLYTTKQKDLDKEIDPIKKITLLNQLYEEMEKDYNLLISKAKDNLIDNNIFIEYNSLIAKANENIVKINCLNVSDEIIASLNKIYNNITDVTAISKLQQFINETNTLLLNMDATDNKEGSFSDRIFNLFAKINDQVVASSFVNKGNYIYALYTLEDNSKYYAIVKKESEVKIIDQSFTFLPNLVLTKDNIINTCEIIIRNASIYYDLNEFMRYIEMSYKTKMTKEIDELIVNYKKRLTYLEENIKMQLDFIDSIALLVNHLPCDKYPNITYNDVPKEEYFLQYENDTNSISKEIKRIIISIFLNPKEKSIIDTKSILKTMYDSKILNDLLNTNYQVGNEMPLVDTTDTVSNNIETTGNIITNYEKINEYLNNRVKELELLASSNKINVTITREDNSIYKDINTVLDINTAVVICDKVYKKGQGIYAILDYLKTGNTLKFTSKYKARELVNSVNKDEYLKLLLENIIKRYIYEKNNNINSNIVVLLSPLLEKNNITIKEIILQILNNDNLIEDGVTNYNYEFLDALSNKSKEVNTLLENSNLINISNILQNIKKNNIIFNGEGK